MKVGIDVNILLRAILDDDQRQSAEARAFLNGLGVHATGRVAAPTLLELFWVLERSYRVDRNDLAEVIATVLTLRHVEVEDYGAASLALDLYRDSNADFADAFVANLNLQNGCDKTVTFDQRAARRIPGMELLA